MVLKTVVAADGRAREMLMVDRRTGHMAMMWNPVTMPGSMASTVSA
jgi:hypothetical protein